MREDTARTTGADITDDTAHRGGRVALIWTCLMAAYAIAFPEQLADPFVRSDDFVSVFPDPDLYYGKTLTEGRWLNYLWGLRHWPGDPVTIQAIVLAGWALMAALVGVALAPGRGEAGLALIVAFAVAVTPQQANIFLWFNTIVPGVLLLAAYAGLVLWAPWRLTEAALFLFVPALLMSHTAFPLIALVLVAALTGPGHGRVRLVGLGLKFVAALGLGLGAIYLLNLYHHGHFGIAVAGWRSVNPLDGVEDLVANAGAAATALAAGLRGAAVLPFGLFALLILLFLAILTLRETARAHSTRVLAMLGLAMAVPSAHTVTNGLVWPFRSTAFIWIGVILVLALAARRGATAMRRGAFVAALSLTVVSGALYWNAMLGFRLAVHQSETRALAERITNAAAPGSPARIVITGQAHGMRGSEVLQNALGLDQRLRLLTGAPAHVCDDQAGNLPGNTEPVERTPTEQAAIDALASMWEAKRRETAEICAAHREAAAALSPYPAPGHVAQIAPGVIGVNLPARILADTPP